MSNKSTISGFTFIKNGLTLGYPILESILSISPFCDEVIINVGFDDPELKVDDGTYQYLREHLSDSKYKFLKNCWDPEMTKDGLILSEQTNLALKECIGDYCQYIQGDEAIHQDDISSILNGIKFLDENSSVDGLIYNYMHFYGNVDTYKYTRSLYRREVRLIRNHKGIKSWLDAQGFRHQNETKIQARLIDARIFHYGWARATQVMKKKVGFFGTLYHGKDHKEKEFRYQKSWGLRKFKKTHPEVMKKWISENRNDLNFERMPLTLDWNVPGLLISDLIEYLTNYRVGEYKNYRIF